jgi:hypothetical protein
MQKLQKKQTLSVLGFLSLALLISGCSSLQPKQIEVSTVPVEKPELELPKTDKIRLREVEWTLITPDNVDEVLEQAEKSGRPVVFFALTDKGYENLGLNISDIRALIQQQKTIISAYENYYKESQEALDGAVKNQENP